MKKVLPKTQKIMEFINKNPKVVARSIARTFNVSTSSVYQIKNRMKAYYKQIGDKVDASIDSNPPPSRPLVSNQVDMINHPPHYKVGGIETLDFIDAKNLSYALGNVVKYITRAKHKGNEIEDLEKAAFYLAHEISNIKKLNTK